MSFRVGQGIDVHQWEDGKPLMIGGVKIPYEKGLKAHSDGDVLLHALIDAMLGAAGLGDIGELFPDTDKQWKDADSKYLLKVAFDDIQKAGFLVVNIDATVVAEEPKLGPYKEDMKEVIGKILNLGSQSIGIKATTAEKMGFIGRGEGIAALAVVLLEPPDTRERFKTVRKR